MVTESAEQRTAVLGPGLSTFVGRDQELEALAGLLVSARLVTLVGPGGSGKTRLALETADQIMATSNREVQFVELAALRDPALVPAAIAGALGLRASGSEAPLELLVRHIRATERLLLLDNLEQLLPAAAEPLAELLAGCPGLCLLVTSRVPLNLRAEHVLRVEPLPVPGTDARLEGLADVPSVALFTERARATGWALALDAAEAPTVGAICRRLDGLPLALELAAARLRLLSPTALLARLEEGLGVLAGGPIDAEERHRTLRDTIAWSVALLPPREAALFGRLGVFRGGFDLSGALAVAGPGIVDSEDELLELLGSLVDHNLVRVIPGPEAQPRFGMLETIREYAREHLEDEATLRDRHLAHYLALAEGMAAHWRRPGHAEAARRIRREFEEFRGALSWGEHDETGENLLRLAASLGPYWNSHGDMREGREWLGRAVASAGDSRDPSQGVALFWLACLVTWLGDQHEGLRICERAHRASLAAADERAAARARWGLGVFRDDERDQPLGRTHLTQALVEAQCIGETSLMADCLRGLGDLAWTSGDHRVAQRCYEQALELARASGDQLAEAFAGTHLGELQILLDHPGEGVAVLEASLATIRDLDSETGIPMVVLTLALALAEEGELERARAGIREGLDIASRGGELPFMVAGLDVTADWLAIAADPVGALRAWATADHCRTALGIPFLFDDEAWRAARRRRAGQAAGEPMASLAWAEGEAMDLEAALSAALRAMDAVDLAHRPNRPGDPRGASLTRREVEVLALVGEGCSDGQIAERLFISKKTASVHVANIKDKLATENRVETALAAVRMGVVPASPMD